MATATCYNLHERLLPHLRAETARRLSGRGLKQSRIAEHLGVSQAMVSKYLRAPPAPPTPTAAALARSVVERAVASVLEEEAKGRLPPWCPLCPQLWPDKEGIPWGLDECLRGSGPPAEAESGAILDNLRQAAARLRAGPFAALAPNVNINIAMVLARARDARGVAAFPGRLVALRGEVRPVAEPQFGASHHLSDLLLRLRRRWPDVRAVMCIRDGEDVRRALRAAGLRHRLLRRARRELVVATPADAPSDALIDPGDFGIEPIVYLLGQTALEAVDKAQRILDRLPTPRRAP